MLNRYRISYVGQDSKDHLDVVWASDHRAAISKIKDQGGEMISIKGKLMSPLMLIGIYLAIAALLGLAVVAALY